MRRKGTAGPDDIPPTFLKALGPTAKTELLSIFNESFSKGDVPGIWKEATILPLKKAGKPPGAISSYRPTVKVHTTEIDRLAAKPPKWCHQNDTTPIPNREKEESKFGCSVSYIIANNYLEFGKQLCRYNDYAIKFKEYARGD